MNKISYMQTHFKEYKGTAGVRNFQNNSSETDHNNSIIW